MIFVSSKSAKKTRVIAGVFVLLGLSLSACADDKTAHTIEWQDPSKHTAVTLEAADYLEATKYDPALEYPSDEDWPEMRYSTCTTEVGGTYTVIKESVINDQQIEDLDVLRYDRASDERIEAIQREYPEMMIYDTATPPVFCTDGQEIVVQSIE